MYPRLFRDVAKLWQDADSTRRIIFAALLSLVYLLALLAVYHVCRTPDALVYLPAYLIFINLFRISWTRYIFDPRQREQMFIAIGFSVCIVRYILLFTPAEPYLDILTVITFYCFAYSQTLVLQESRRLRLLLNAAFLASLACFVFLVAQYWLSLYFGPRPYFLARLLIETRIGPVWLLASISAFIVFLLDFHVRAALEIDDFAIRLRLGFLTVSWFFLLVFFILDEGCHFGWFQPHRHLSDFFLVLPVIGIGLGLAMPRWVERVFTGLHFLDRRTSREITLFALTHIARHSTGSPLTDLSLAAAEGLNLSREDCQEIYLACEFLEEGYPAEAHQPAAESSWERLLVASVPERRRFADEQRLVFRAWRLKRAVENGTLSRGVTGRLIVAAKDYLLGKTNAGHDPALWAAVDQAARQTARPPADLPGPDARTASAAWSYEKKVSQRTRPTRKR